jgi:hypothetical protein
VEGTWHRHFSIHDFLAAAPRFARFNSSTIIMAGMCRSIKVLRRPDEAATRQEISAAALQFVRKVSGFRQPSRANQPAFDAAILEISDSVERLLEKVGATSPRSMAHAPKQ